MSAPSTGPEAHALADAAGQDGYIDPESGLFVMTRGYLVRRGSCCSNDCRHCPYTDGELPPSN